MDWSRAKTILILSFMLLNAVLGYQLWSSRADLLDLEASSSGAAEELQKLVKAKNIQVPADIPKDVPKLTEIVAKFDETVTTGRPAQLDRPLRFDPLISRGSLEEILQKSGIPKVDAYQYDTMTSFGGTYIFHQLYGTLPLFDVQLKLIEEGGLVTSYQQSYAVVQSDPASGDESAREVKGQKVITAYIALRTLIENYLPTGSVITGVKLGYHGQPYNSQTRNMWPAWRISLGNGQVYYVHALNGAIEEPQKVK